MLGGRREGIGQGGEERGKDKHDGGPRRESYLGREGEGGSVFLGGTARANHVMDVNTSAIVRSLPSLFLLLPSHYSLEENDPVYMGERACVCVYVCMMLINRDPVYACVCVCRCVCLCVCVCQCVCLCLCVCLYVCACVCSLQITLITITISSSYF